MVNERDILVYLVRHGETSLNKEGKFRGAVNAPLDKDGFRDANRLAAYFEPIDVAYIFCSPKKRTLATAAIIAKRKGIEPIETKFLMPWDIGDFGGQPKTDENLAALHCYIDNPDTPPPGGMALNQFRAQVHPTVEEGIELSEDCGRPVIFVSHSSVVHESSALITGDHMACKVKPGGVVAIFKGRDGKIYAEPVLKPDKSAETQNVLGTHRPTTIS